MLQQSTVYSLTTNTIRLTEDLLSESKPQVLASIETSLQQAIPTALRPVRRQLSSFLERLLQHALARCCQGLCWHGGP